MATTYATIVMRRGAWDALDKSKLKAGEWAVVLSGDTGNSSDGASIYMSFGSGKIKQVCTTNEMTEYLANMLEDIENDFTASVDAATKAANTAAANANSATTTANNAASKANTAASNANTAAKAANASVISSVSATSLAAGSAPTVALANNKLSFGIPKGDKGDTGATGAKGDKGDTGATGATPDVSATATVSNTSGTPAVSVTKSGTTDAPSFAFAFSNIKGDTGATGAKGDKGDTGATGAAGKDGGLQPTEFKQYANRLMNMLVSSIGTRLEMLDDLLLQINDQCGDNKEALLDIRFTRTKPPQIGSVYVETIAELDFTVYTSTKTHPVYLNAGDGSKKEHECYYVYVVVPGMMMFVLENNNIVYNRTTALRFGVGTVDTSNVTDMNYMFGNCASLTSLDLSSFDTSNVTDMNYMFGDCASLTSLDLSSFDTSNVTDMNYMFGNCASLTSLDLSSFDTSNVTDMNYMFGNCASLTSLDLSSFDTSNVTDMNYMFGDCASLTSLDLSSFDTSNVTDMNYMFGNCASLTSLDLSSFDTSNVTDMNYMFGNCASLTSLDLSSFDTSNVTDMNYMFGNCASLTSLDLSSFDTSNVTDMNYMFGNCASLTSLDLSSFDTSNVTDMDFMFELGNVTDGAYINEVKFGEVSIADNMFTNTCIKTLTMMPIAMTSGTFWSDYMLPVSLEWDGASKTLTTADAVRSAINDDITAHLGMVFKV